MDWLTSLGIVGMIALCCGGKLLALLLAARAGSSEPATPESGCLRGGHRGRNRRSPPGRVSLLLRGVGMEAVLRILEADWQEPLRCTNLEQAMDRAGLPFRDADRRRIARAILEDPRLADLLRWHPSAYFLTNDERLVAGGVLRTLQGSTEEDRLARGVSETLLLPEAEVRAALDALVWIGFLERDQGSLRLSPEAPRFLEGVGFSFHEVAAGTERFNVNCFHDFALLTSPTYRARRLQNPTRRSPDAPGMTPKMRAFLQSLRPEDLFRRTYDRGTVHLHDACAQCMRRIRLTVTDGRLVAVDPPGVWHVRGGGCGMNNLFCGAGCAEEWVHANPHLGDPERGPVGALWPPALRAQLS